MLSGASGAAFVWQSGVGIQNLNNYLPAGANWSLPSAEGVNNDGVIVGYGYPPGYSYPNAHGFLLVPAP